MIRGTNQQQTLRKSPVLPFFFHFYPEKGHFDTVLTETEEATPPLLTLSFFQRASTAITLMFFLLFTLLFELACISRTVLKVDEQIDKKDVRRF